MRTTGTVVVLLSLLLTGGKETKHKIPTRTEVVAAVKTGSKKFKHINYQLALSLAWSESTYIHIDSRGRIYRGEAGEFGVLQVMKVHEKRGRDLTKLEDNIYCGLSFLALRIKQRKGNLFLALLDYNWGPDNVAGFLRGEKRIPATTQVWVSNILSKATRL